MADFSAELTSGPTFSRQPSIESCALLQFPSRPFEPSRPYESAGRSRRCGVCFGWLALAWLAVFGGAVVAQAQTNCGACWAGVTQWHGTWNLTLTGSGINNYSQGTFDITNGASVVTGSGFVSGTFSGCFCNCSGSGALDPSSHVQIVIDTTNCTYSLWLSDILNYTFTYQLGSFNTTEYCSGESAIPAGTIPEAVLPYFPLPLYGQTLEQSGSFPVPYPGVGCYGGGGATLTISWHIEPIIDSSPPRFTHLPVGGDPGCNPTNIPDAGAVSDDTDATSSSGQYSISVRGVDVTNGCAVTRSFSLTVTDNCSEQQAHALVVYSWRQDTEPPVITGVPAGGSLGCNPTNAPTDASVQATLGITDDCGVTTTNVTHVDTTNGCAITRTFTITAADACGNVSAPSTVVYSWTLDSSRPVITAVPAGGNLGCNPNNLPTDASVKAQVQATDNCGVAAKNVSHTDTINGCAITRIFTVTAADNCGNASPPSTVVYSWTADTSAPTFTQLPPGGYLGTNPPCVPDDGLVQAEAQVSDNCGVASVSTTHSDSGTSNLYTRTFAITATDFCGNPATATVTYTWSGTASGAISAPVLGISLSGSNVLLSWSTGANCFILVSSTNLGSGYWTAVTNIPAVLGTQFLVTNSVTSSRRFYRLAR